MLFLITFISIIPLSLILPMLPFLGDQLGATPFEISLAFALYPVMTLFAAPLWGRLSDRIGRRPAIIASLIGTALALVFLAFADTLEWLYLARAAQGVVAGSLPIAFAMVADSHAPADRSIAIGKLGAAMGSGFMIGPVIGGLLMGATAAEFDARLPLLFGAAMAIVAALGSFRLRETRAPAESGGEYRPHDPDKPRRNEMITALAVPAVWLLIAQFIVSGFMQGSLNLSYSLWAGTIENWGPRDVSFGLGALGLGFIIANGVLIRPMTRRFGDETTLFIGTLIDAAGLIWFIAGNLMGYGGLGVFAGLVLSVLGQGIWSTVLIGVISRNTPDAHQGLILGVANGAGMIGRVGGPLTAGWLLYQVSPIAPFWLGLALIFFVSMQALRYALRARRAQTPEQTAQGG